MILRFRKIVIVIGAVFLLAGLSFSQGTCSEAGSIKRVKNTNIGRYEYVVFDIIKPNEPDYKVETRKPPFTDYSGDETFKIKGKKFKVISFSSLNWMCNPKETFRLSRRSIKDIKELYTFEGYADYVVGYNSRYVGTYHYDVGSIRKVVMRFRK